MLPLGLDAPTMLLDLDSFVEAVTNCVDSVREDSLREESMREGSMRDEEPPLH